MLAWPKITDGFLAELKEWEQMELLVKGLLIDNCKPELNPYVLMRRSEIDETCVSSSTSNSDVIDIIEQFNQAANHIKPTIHDIEKEQNNKLKLQL
ncbi:MAG: hypothetical protein EZS28_029201 [Streblomastix strix]|uniref:Uncharacterized protein n=1 Tax=Streblomastix strix TaxID=222440 RepID=A0A5J4UZH2_9EUKA|nr:MAG: hypothetical protein EZS28_029201 [Streblomastix strix]